MNKELINYVKDNIIPQYLNFDKAHNIEHVKSVIKRSFEIAENLDENLNSDMIFVVAAYHDMGMTVNRKNHNLHSGNIIRNDEYLKSCFDEIDIEKMAEAVEDHSTHLKRKPKNIYGQIVSDADKDIDIDNALKRTWQFAKKYFPSYDEEQKIEDVYDDLCKRYGKNGAVKFWLSDDATNTYFKEMKKIALNKDLFNEKIKEIINNDIDYSKNKNSGLLI
jgi:uncharacterized protein